MSVRLKGITYVYFLCCTIDGVFNCEEGENVGYGKPDGRLGEILPSTYAVTA